MWDPGLDPGTEKKDTCGKTGEIRKKVFRFVDSTNSNYWFNNFAMARY